MALVAQFFVEEYTVRVIGEPRPPLRPLPRLHRAISPSGRSLAYTFFEGYQCNIWVLRRQMGSPQMKVDQLHQQCGYPFSLDDRMISFDLDGSRGTGLGSSHLTVSQRENVRPKYFTCCLTFGIFEYEAMEEDLDENGEICFNYCRLLRNISLECRKGDCFQHIMLNPAKNEITLYAVACPAPDLDSRIFA
eukprot:tig00020616_g12296.t1